MGDNALRLLIQRKLQDGRLPRAGLAKAQSSPGNGEKCEACEEIVTRDRMMVVVEVVLPTDASATSREAPSGKESIHFHVACYSRWDAERGDMRNA